MQLETKMQRSNRLFKLALVSLLSIGMLAACAGDGENEDPNLQNPPADIEMEPEDDGVESTD